MANPRTHHQRFEAGSMMEVVRARRPTRIFLPVTAVFAIVIALTLSFGESSSSAPIAWTVASSADCGYWDLSPQPTCTSSSKLPPNKAPISAFKKCCGQGSSLLD